MLCNNVVPLNVTGQEVILCRSCPVLKTQPNVYTAFSQYQTRDSRLQKHDTLVQPHQLFPTNTLNFPSQILYVQDLLLKTPVRKLNWKSHKILGNNFPILVTDIMYSHLHYKYLFCSVSVYIWH